MGKLDWNACYFTCSRAMQAMAACCPSPVHRAGRLSGFAVAWTTRAKHRPDKNLTKIHFSALCTDACSYSFDSFCCRMPEVDDNSESDFFQAARHSQQGRRQIPPECYFFRKRPNIPVFAAAGADDSATGAIAAMAGATGAESEGVTMAALVLASSISIFSAASAFMA